MPLSIEIPYQLFWDFPGTPVHMGVCASTCTYVCLYMRGGGIGYVYIGFYVVSACVLTCPKDLCMSCFATRVQHFHHLHLFVCILNLCVLGRLQAAAVASQAAICWQRPIMKLLLKFFYEICIIQGPLISLRAILVPTPLMEGEVVWECRHWSH